MTTKGYFLATLATVFLVITFVFAKGLPRSQVLGEADQSKPVKGLIIPHHDLANSMIIEAIDAVAKTVQPTRIIVLSPNHFQPNAPWIVSATKFHDFNLDTKSIEALAIQANLYLDESLLAPEHGLAVPMHYLAATFPHAQFVPLMLSPYNVSVAKISSLAATLAQLSSDNTLLVLSSDFAHYLTLNEALLHNQHTLSLIENFDRLAILPLTDQYLDAPVAAAVFLEALQMAGAINWQLLDSSHGALLLSQPTLQGTSYITGLFK